MNGYRQQILQAVAAAADIHKQFPTAAGNAFDVLGAAIGLDIPVLYRPLGGLWGATVQIGEKRGVLVTTKIGRPVQRFTLAHEVGHVVLDHRTQFDLGGFTDAHRDAYAREPEERAANAFASELLAAPGLIQAIAVRHQWSRNSLVNPDRIYQLSLRLGASFAATCWALNSMKILSAARAAEIALGGVKTWKLALVSEDLLVDPWADVWQLSERDVSAPLEAGPYDVFVVTVQEHASAGFLWQVQSDPSVFVLTEQRSIPQGAYGSASEHTFVLRFKESVRHQLLLQHSRPWNNELAQQLELSIDTRGKELAGLPRRLRERALAVSA
jgi:predicted secreted protein